MEPVWLRRMRAVASRQRAIVVGGAVLLGAVGVSVPLATGATSGPYDGAKIACAISSRVSVDVKGSGFPAKAPVKLSFESLGLVVATASTTTSASGKFTSLLVVPSTVVAGEITATVETTSAVVNASCSVELRL